MNWGFNVISPWSRVSNNLFEFKQSFFQTSEKTQNYSTRLDCMTLQCHIQFRLQSFILWVLYYFVTKFESLLFFVPKARGSAQAAAASVAGVKPVKNKKFLIYRWNPEKQGDKPRMQVLSGFLRRNIFSIFVSPAPTFFNLGLYLQSPKICQNKEMICCFFTGVHPGFECRWSDGLGRVDQDQERDGPDPDVSPVLPGRNLRLMCHEYSRCQHSGLHQVTNEPTELKLLIVTHSLLQKNI